MKKVFFLIILLIKALDTFSSDFKGLTYNDISLKNIIKFKRISRNIADKINPILYRSNYLPISNSEIPQVYFADNIYRKNDSLVMFKFGVLAPKKLDNKIVKYKNGYLFHSNGSIPFAVLGLQVERSKVKKIAILLKNQLKDMERNESVFHLENYRLIPTAHADNSNCFNENPMESVVDLTDYQKVSKHISLDSMLSMTSDCFMSAVSSAWESTGGIVSDVGGGIWNFIKNPIKNISKAWDGAVNMVKVTSDFIGNIRDNLKSVGAVLSGISTHLLAKILCTITGAIGGEHLLKMLINPAVGLALLVPKISKIFIKLKSLGDILPIIDKASKSFKKSSSLVSSAIKNLLTKGSQQFIKKVKKLSNNGFTKLTLRYASCGG